MSSSNAELLALFNRWINKGSRLLINSSQANFNFTLFGTLATSKDSYLEFAVNGKLVIQLEGATLEASEPEPTPFKSRAVAILTISFESGPIFNITEIDTADRTLDAQVVG